MQTLSRGITMDEMKNKPLVSICSITYNHAPYIRQCLEGFLMQKTNFPFEVIINDDCSTDGTTEIIREYAEKYPNIIKPIYHNENLYSKGQRGFFQKFCFPKAEGKYIALCEGDDYWTDPLKLVKQVEILENNPNISICCHNAIVHSESDKNKYPFVTDISEGIVPMSTLILHSWFTPTASFLFLRKCLDNFPIECKINGDMLILFTLASKGNLYFINQFCSVYRYNTVFGTSASATTSTMQLYKKKINLMNYIDSITSRKYILYTFRKRLECYKGMLYCKLIKVKRSFF